MWERRRSTTVGGRVPRTRPSIQRPWHCAGSKLARKYKMGLGPISEMESPPGWNPGILVQQLDYTEVPSSRHQRTGSETGYGRLNINPILRSASICVYILLSFDYSIISLLLFNLHAFHFYFYQLCTLVLLVLLTLSMKWKINEKIFTNIHSK